MKLEVADMQFAEYLQEQFYDVGNTPEGGVTRLGYTPIEDEMHRVFIRIGTELGYDYDVDAVGNTFLGSVHDDRLYTLIGSHLDSVIEGGRYDGVAGVMAGLMVLRWAKEAGLDLPIRVVAFRCEESSNFGQCTIGSGLVTESLSPSLIGELQGKDGKTLAEIFQTRGYCLEAPQITRVKEYLELHIEQGKVLETREDDIGIVTDIAGPDRYRVEIQGVADHSGATPMGMRQDALCAASEIILLLEELGREESQYSTVATVGVIQNQPNVLNVIPGAVELGVDIRGIDVASIERVALQMKEHLEEISQRRHVAISLIPLGHHVPVRMNRRVGARLLDIAENLQLRPHVMASGAGHDAMNFATICPTAMLFIPCYQGISHNKREFTSVDSIVQGARILWEYIKGELT